MEEIRGEAELREVLGEPTARDAGKARRELDGLDRAWPAKAFLRSGLWRPEGWEPDAAPSRARIAHGQERRGQDLAELEAYDGPGYGLDQPYG